MKVVTFGEVMLRLAPENYLRFGKNVQILLRIKIIRYSLHNMPPYFFIITSRRRGSKRFCGLDTPCMQTSRRRIKRNRDVAPQPKI